MLMKIWRKVSSDKYALIVINGTNNNNVYVVEHIENAKHLFSVADFMVTISLAMTLLVNSRN